MTNNFSVRDASADVGVPDLSAVRVGKSLAFNAYMEFKHNGFVVYVIVRAGIALISFRPKCYLKSLLSKSGCI